MPRINDIETRLAAIRGELDAEGADLMALNAEVDSLISERAGILAAAETRRGILDSIARNTSAQVETVLGVPPAEDEQRGMTAADPLAAPEYRSGYLNRLRGKALSDAEARAMSTATNSVGAAVPTQTANMIFTKLKQVAPMLNEIELLSASGNVTFAVEGEIADAAKHAENANISAADVVLTKVTLSAFEIVKLVAISKSVQTMAIDAFETWLVDMLVRKLGEKIEALIFKGTGTGEATGIESANTWDATNSVTVGKDAALATKDVLGLIALLKAQYDRGAKFVMCKKTLFTDVMPLEDMSKNKLVTYQGGRYYIYGYPVLLSDEVAYHEAFLGDWKKYIGNMPQDMTITGEFDINTNGYKYLGACMFDGKAAVGEAFVKLVKASA